MFSDTARPMLDSTSFHGTHAVTMNMAWITMSDPSAIYLISKPSERIARYTYQHARGQADKPFFDIEELSATEI
jgi:hypothetical protein